MSQTYSTGDLAKLAGVSVRTVQYYDKHGILEPSQLSQGGRRIYSQADLEQLQIICFLRDLDFSIEQIKRVLAEASVSQVLSMLLEDNIASLRQDLAKRREQFDRSVKLLDTLKAQSGQSLKLVSDMTLVMDNQKNWHRLQLKWWSSMIVSAGAYTALMLFVPQPLWLQWTEGLLFIIYFTGLVLYFRRQYIYLCPNCHQLFEPSLKESAWAGRAPRTRKLTCPHCHKISYCLELAKEKK
ncbi:MerR family transcriptional regulator [Streptococcus sobrinus]|uniref:MerR family transcriptional regulator n=1 Tax=Streptococcus sobrinus TaxID=1310 RepID=UPI0002FA4EE6|nr:MerR family transcriptional regulator [Streptococcus sobrinus]